MPSISDAAVVNATRRNWKEWFAMLDAAGGRKMSHREIVGVLTTAHAVGPWWRQMVTVEYERARGLRARHETAKGFNATSSKTMLAPVSRVYKAWATAAGRRTWLGVAELTVRTATTNKSMRITWSDGTSVAVAFTPKPGDKTQVALDHTKLPSAASVARMKSFWKKHLAELQQVVER
jgi:uncharacterized protein YndB with AHSA1/START domain